MDLGKCLGMNSNRMLLWHVYRRPPVTWFAEKILLFLGRNHSKMPTKQFSSVNCGIFRCPVCSDTQTTGDEKRKMSGKHQASNHDYMETSGMEMNCTSTLPFLLAWKMPFWIYSSIVRRFFYPSWRWIRKVSRTVA